MDAGGWGYRAAAGDSVAVNGCCLTAVRGAARGNRLVFDVIPETLAKTTLGGLRAGERVNLEHAATAMTLLGGHMVQGHVDGVARVEKIETKGEWRVRVRPPAGLMPYMVGKGSVCLDGVSLTLAAVGRGWIEVALIPTTLEMTTLASWRVGGDVNIEADAMAKTVVGWLENWSRERRPKRRTGKR